ncbi:ATP-binding protein [Thalassotalea castellviae]|uniref:histidine kinase n=1 Tax=Thalassotalea castellviae TaxID=3075612 RepID=A0ABU2ZZI2_9GAMM|nr:ATP-binding protein [Thalassotalea sp. W431]MDT0603340.1 ATP-binding protein [Thalassotalea sp. W431]
MALAGKNQVVTRYKLSIIGVFIAIMLVALILASFRYYGELRSMEQNELTDLISQTNDINRQFNQAASSVQAIQDYANHTINFPEEVPLKLPLFVQENERFYLQKSRHDILKYRQELSVNITGIGDISEIKDTFENELAMAHSLTPAFMAAQNAIETANWFYYVSENQFVSIYPWVNRNNWQYSNNLIENEHVQRLRNTTSNFDGLLWSAPYIGTSSKSLYTAVGGPVFFQDKYIGAVIINIDLSRLHQKVLLDIKENETYVLINNKGQVLLNRSKHGEPLKKQVSWKNTLPESLANLTLENIHNLPASSQFNALLVQKAELAIDGWLLLKYKPFQAFTNPIFERFMGLFFLLFFGQIVLLAVVYTVTSKTFIKPTQQFISHIAYSAKGDHGKIKPPSGWLHWFNLVGDIFSQNRSLMQQLKEQNNILDSKVNDKTQALLEKSKQHQHDYAILHSVMDAIPDYLIFNDPHGLLIGCNLAFETFIGKKEHAILGRQAGGLIPNELGTALLEAANKSKTQTKHAQGIFQVIETVDNTYELFTSEFFDQEQQVLGTIIIIRDVTEQYAINAALAAAKEQAELANQTKSQFLANMSHEIRTPINAIQGMHSLLEKTPISNQQRKHLASAQNASGALLHLIDELLDLAKIESGNMSIMKAECRLDRIVSQAINLNIGNANNKGIELIVTIESNVPVIAITDEMRLVQVLSNLLNNAIKFTHEGSVTIHLAVIAISDIDTLVRFRIIDTGIGIAKEKQSHLFEAFMQADESMTREYGGSGLGLSICQRIINLLGGEIKIISEEGVGTEFNFVLPLKINNDNPYAKYNKNVQIFCLDYQLPASFNALIEDYEFQYHLLSSPDDINHYSALKLNILFIDANEVDEHLCNVLVEQLCHAETLNSQEKKTQDQDKEKQCMLAVCLPDQSQDYSVSFEYLDKYQLPYIVCEAPLSRNDLFNVIDSSSGANRQKVEPIQHGSSSEIITEVAPQNLANVSILLVEDNLVNQLVAKELLKSMQAEITVVENGQLAIESLEKSSFDVVLMDIQMPVMDGLTATKIVRKNEKFKDLPIIAMTAHARQEDIENSLAAGMNLHIAKPVNAELLLSSILKVLKKA